MALLGVEARKRKAAERLDRETNGDNHNGHVNGNRDGNGITASVDCRSNQARNDDPYVRDQVKRLRQHIDRLNAKLLEAEDAGEIDRLASALGRLREMERQLSGRPLPGSYRPTETAKRSRGRAMFCDDEPQDYAQYDGPRVEQQ